MSSPQVKDEELIRLYLNTQKSDYFETLYNRYVNKVYRRCLSLTKDATQAEDFTHDIFLRVFGNLGRFQEKSTFSTWLYSISYNYCMDQLRQANRTTTIALDQEHDHLADAEVDPVHGQLQQLAYVLTGISAEETQLLRLRYEEELDIRTIAQRLDLNESTVKMRLKRTRDKLRRMYEQQSV
ncbi:RNA polymerase sigma factor [Fibrisoma montanum]|uniref:RNA polymerase sigma factor n=1 Tax=Fibrisoma montanum TaxID=2305895 RepID=A0A418MAS0_9BACT|nr:RNA polymerase sigma factor [Fibrisoma montanum]RIV23472.1 RNA polymerase sigma factor [Fibrisoma montanum]